MADNPGAYMPTIMQASHQYGVPPQILQAEIMARSGGNPMPATPDHGNGIMNLSPAQAGELGVQNPTDMDSSIMQTAQFLAQQYEKFGDWKMAVASLASNPALVAHHGGVPPIPEVQAHVQQIMQGVGLPGVGAAPQGSPTGVGATPGLGLSAPTNALEQLKHQIEQMGGFPSQPQPGQHPPGQPQPSQPQLGQQNLPARAGGTHLIPNITGIEGRITQVAKGFLGVPYKWGGNSRASGLDCSGFIQNVFKDIGISLPRTTFDQVKVGQAVNLKQLQAGDVVFTEPGHAGPNHVGLYVGHGMVQQSPHTGTVNGYISLRDFLGGGFVAARRYTGMLPQKGKK